ncbi:MAG TPA: PQQ-binding-like beta-propeller repeat protein, partial [Anaerolineae bacterium]|nr:PQQ-binding-like beta-propeller repeat protein [Anaerolineae bacterium]
MAIGNLTTGQVEPVLAPGAPSVHEAEIRSRVEAQRGPAALADVPVWQSRELGAPLSGRVAAEEGVVYAAIRAGMVWALSLGSGKTLWQSQLAGESIEGDLTLWRQFVLVPCRSGRLVLLDRRRGKVSRALTLGDELRAAPCVQGDAAYLAVNKGSQGEVHAVYLETGRERVWRVPARVRAAPLLWGSLLLIGSRDGTLYAFDAGLTGGDPLWSFATTNQLVATPVLDERGETILFGSCDGALYGLGRQGQARWPPLRTGMYAQVVASGAISGGKAFFGNSEGTVTALDVATGQPVWPQPARAGQGIAASPVVWGGLVFVGANDGLLYCLDARDGRVVWKLPTEGPIHCAPVITGAGQVLVSGSGEGSGRLRSVPWHNEQWADMAAWAESDQRWAVAGELWARAGDAERGVDALRRARSFVRAAEVSEAGGYFDRAAGDWEKAAAATGESRDAGLVFLRAAQAWGRAGDTASAERCWQQSAALRQAPRVIVRCRGGEKCQEGDCVQLAIEVANAGAATAYDVRLEASGAIGSLPAVEVGILPPGATRHVTVEV